MRLLELERHQDTLLFLADRSPREEDTFRLVSATLTGLYAALDHAAAAGAPAVELRELLAPARAIHGLSPFVRRLQSSPRGQLADHETCEAMLSAAPRPAAGTLARAIEVAALSWAVVRQHRLDVGAHAIELRMLARQARMDRRAARVLVLGAGSAPEVRAALPALANADVEIVICDSDAAALAFCRRELAGLGSRVQFCHTDAARPAVDLAEGGRFELILAGSLFDHMGDGDVAAVLRRIAGAWLARGGRLVASHLARPNPSRVLLEVFTAWRPIERNERHLRALVSDAGSGLGVRQLTLDPSGVSWHLRAGGSVRYSEAMACAQTLPMGL